MVATLLMRPPVKRQYRYADMNTDLVDSSLSKPRTLRWAVMCLALSSGLAAVMVGALWTRLVVPPPGSSNAVNVVTFVSLALITWKVATGRGWARWLFVVMYALGSLAGAVTLLLKPDLFGALPTPAIASMLTQLVLQTAAVTFLLTRSARDWFKRHRVQSTSSAAA